MTYFGSASPQQGWIDLSLGHPYYEPPGTALQQGAHAVTAARGGYLPPAGMSALREALASKLLSRNGIPVAAKDVVVTAGGSMGLFATLAAIAPPGTPVLVPDPGFPLYCLALETLRLVPVPYRLEPELGWMPDLDRLPSAPVMIWNSPHNPLGVVAPKAFVDQLTALARRRQMWLISDEVYEDLIFEGEHASPAASCPELTYSVFSFSKSHGMAGWRVGYVAAPPGRGEALARTHWAAAMSTSTMAQWAALGAVKAGAAYREEVLAGLRERLDAATAVLRAASVPFVQPEGALYLWLDLRGWVEDSTAFCQALAMEEHVLVNPGAQFGATGEGYVRVCFSIADQNRLIEGVQRLVRFVRKFCAPPAQQSWSADDVGGGGCIGREPCENRTG